MKIRKTYAAVGVLAIGIVVFFFGAQVAHERVQDRAAVNRGMARLELIARETVTAKAAGVVAKICDGPSVESVVELSNYIKRHYPKTLSDSNEGNPFPGILPSTGYATLKGTAQSKNERLIASPWFHYKPGDMRYVLRCSGVTTVEVS